MAESNPIEGIFDSDVITEEQMKSMFAPKFGVIKPNPKKPLDPEIVKQLKAWVLKQQSLGEGEMPRGGVKAPGTLDKGAIGSGSSIPPSAMLPPVKDFANVFGREYDDPEHPVDKKHFDRVFTPLSDDTKQKVYDTLLKPNVEEIKKKYNIFEVQYLLNSIIPPEAMEQISISLMNQGVSEKKALDILTNTLVNHLLKNPLDELLRTKEL